MDSINALGFIEVYGLVPGIEAADAMLKSARVRLLRQYEVQPGLITVVVEGDLAACQAAVNAGVAAASRIGKVVSSLLIPRPDGDTATMVLDLVGTERKKAPATQAGGSASATPAAQAGEAEPAAAKKAPAKAPKQAGSGPAAKPAKTRTARSRKPSPKE